MNTTQDLVSKTSVLLRIKPLFVFRFVAAIGYLSFFGMALARAL